MELEEVLARIGERIRSRQIETEALVRQSAILPILRATGWDDADPGEVVPEFDVPGGRVDFALGEMPGRPLVFIEAKRLGGAGDRGLNQLFGYAANRGVPFLILTDGAVWQFYLSMADGPPEERIFWSMDLSAEGPAGDRARHSRDFLGKENIVAGRARQSAERTREENRRREKARETIPRAWSNILRQPDSLLRDLVREEAERLCGTAPQVEDIEAFLRERAGEPAAAPPRLAAPDPPKSLTPAPRPAVNAVPASNPPRAGGASSPSSSRVKMLGFVLDGQSVEAASGKQTLILLLKRLHERDPGFLERFALETKGRTRNLISRDRGNLYLAAAYLKDTQSETLVENWWIGTNLSSEQIVKHVETACRLAGIEFGSQLTLIER